MADEAPDVKSIEEVPIVVRGKEINNNLISLLARFLLIFNYRSKAFFTLGFCLDLFAQTRSVVKGPKSFIFPSIRNYLIALFLFPFFCLPASPLRSQSNYGLRNLNKALRRTMYCEHLRKKESRDGNFSFLSPSSLSAKHQKRLGE